MTKEDNDLIHLTATIVSEFFAHNSVPRGEIGALISSTHSALRRLGAKPEAPSAPVVLVAAVPIRKSVTPDAIICLEDGKAFKSLKRHLNRTYNLTPEQYRAKWGLPSDYPIVAPNYSETRSALARASGLGRKAQAAPADPVVAEPSPSKSISQKQPSA